MKTLPRLFSCLAALALAASAHAADAQGKVVKVDTKVDVKASSMAGAKFVAPETGTYTLTVLSGAFCYLPQQAGQPSPYDGWLTQLQYFKKAVAWGAADEWGKHPVGADGSVGNGDHQPSKGAAASAGKGSKTTVELEKGQVLTLLVSDGTDWYADNEGSVQVGITAEIVLPPEETPVETPEDS